MNRITEQWNKLFWYRKQQAVINSGYLIKYYRKNKFSLAEGIMILQIWLTLGGFNTVFDLETLIHVPPFPLEFQRHIYTEQLTEKRSNNMLPFSKELDTRLSRLTRLKLNTRAFSRLRWPMLSQNFKLVYSSLGKQKTK